MFTSARAISFVITVFVTACVLHVSVAQAQWRVIDRATNDRLGAVSATGRGAGSVTGNLKDLYEQQKFDRYRESESSKAAPEPKEKLTPQVPSRAVNLTVEQRCPRPRSDGVAYQQWQLCRDIVTTEMAQYDYSLQMYEITTLRQRRLDEIKRERGRIQAHETGRLQDNTNKLLALLSQMEIDRQQQKTYMDAYDARLRYLVAARNTLAQQALEGTKSGSGSGSSMASSATGIVSSAVGFLSLQEALDRRKTGRNTRKNY